jgi:ATP-binding cassette subfamily B protein
VDSLDRLSWPAARLGEALETLGRRSGLGPLWSKATAAGPAVGPQDDGVATWIEAAAAGLGLQAEPVEASHGELDSLLGRLGPAIVRLPGGKPGFVALLEGGNGSVKLLAPDLLVHRVATDALRGRLCHGIESELRGEVDVLLERARIPPRRRPRTAAALLRERLQPMRLQLGWLLRESPGGHVRDLVRHARLGRSLFGLAGTHAVEYGLWILSWWVLGKAALEGRLDSGWLLAWALLLATLLPFRVLVTRLQGGIAVRAGSLLKQRLLWGALRLEPEEVRHQGLGQLLGRVIESEAVESMALNGGFLALVAVVELCAGAVVLGLGAGGWVHSLLLAAWTTLAILLAGGYLRRRGEWTANRVEMTHDLVERVVGHRTRLAQERSDRWHEEEDQALARYLARSRSMDGTAGVVVALVPRGFLLVALLGVAPAFVYGQASAAALAISLGGSLLAYAALQKLSVGLLHLMGAVVAWTHVAPLFRAASRPEDAGTLRPQLGHEPGNLLDARELGFRHGDRAQAVLRGCSLRIEAGDRLLLEGPSGSGKSTLAALLTGLRQPDSGVVLLRGLDRQSLGARAWRQRVAIAPQFHENYVFTETLAFNLLMGRAWPPSAQDMEEAEGLCRELGLASLLERMPGGLLQMVGESGWQLSHGERSRLYVARALLQGAELVVLDESFAALDPENLLRVMRCVLDRSPSLLLIAHP